MAKKDPKPSSATEVGDAKNPVPPESSGPPPPPPPKEGEKAEKVYEFVKNVNISEPIPLKGYEQPFVFPRNPFHTTDEKLAKALRAVEEAGTHKVIENKV